MTLHRTANVNGLSVFYREAGTPGAPKLVLLGGFPASSHQFRNLLPALADRFHVISPDYPGFGNTDMPNPSTFPYTFDRLSEIVEGLLTQTGFTRAGFFMQDYGGPIGFRILGRNPQWMEWLILQNTNAYEEGFTSAWDGLRNALWKNRSAEAENALLPFLELDGIKLVYTHGHSHPDQISPGDSATSSSRQRVATRICATCPRPNSTASSPGTSPSKTASSSSPATSAGSTPNGWRDAERLVRSKKTGAKRPACSRGSRRRDSSQDGADVLMTDDNPRFVVLKKSESPSFPAANPLDV